MFGERCGILVVCVNFLIGDRDVAWCRITIILEGDILPRIGVAGICADLQRNALTLLDVDRFAAVVGSELFFFATYSACTPFLKVPPLI